MAPRKILSINQDAKTIKGLTQGYLTGILYLAPARLGGLKNVCKYSSKACRCLCINQTGRGQFNNVQVARINKTVLLIQDEQTFLDNLKINIVALVKKARRNGLQASIRLNGTSDLPWESKGIMSESPSVVFYDYTKDHVRMSAYLAGKFPSNYSLTFSRSENNEAKCLDVLSKGGNVAVVFRTKELPTHWQGYQVVKGDKNDLRFLDPKGVVVGLYAKGKKARNDKSGFVVD
jgi:hypothetical protein